jgi:parallel beta-helix repeat protein
MKCLRQGLAATGFSLAVALSASIGACADFYVATNGNDAWSGLLPAPASNGTDGPFASLEAARNAIRTLKSRSGLPAGGARVNLRGGRYMRQSSFKLTYSPNDSGTPLSPIVYQAYPGETPCILGGVQIAGFNVVTNAAILARLSASAQTNVQVATLTDQVITNLIPLARHGVGLWWNWTGQNELYFQDQPMQLARWPNTNWLSVAASPALGADHFSFIGSNTTKWTWDTNTWVQGYFGNEWGDNFQHVASLSVTNGTTNTVYLTAPQASYGYVTGGRFYFLNVLEELDSPGEYYIDRVNGLLYFWPPSSLREEHPFVSTAGKGGTINGGGVFSYNMISNVVLSGITFVGGVGPLVEIYGGRDNLVSNCTFTGSSCDGVDLMNTFSTVVTRCTIAKPGEQGLFVHCDRAADRLTLAPTTNSVTFNTIHDMSRLCWTYNPGIQIDDVGNYVAYNLIYNGRHNAILISGNNHVLEYNEIRNVCTETSDSGAVYMGRNWTMRGNILRYNYIHNVNQGGGAISSSGVRGIYMDDCWSGTTIFGNVLCNTDGGVVINGGRDNLVQNNIFVGCTTEAIYAAQPGFTYDASLITNTNSQLWTNLYAMPYQSPPWSVQYPALVSIATNNPGAALGNIIRNNISYNNGAWINSYNGALTNLAIANNFTSGDPLFVNYGARNFTLSTNSPAWVLGFQPIPMNAFGPVLLPATGLKILGPP